MTDAPEPDDMGERATAIYQAMLPVVNGQPIEAVSMAMIAHLAAMIDLGAPGMGAARKACVDLGDQLWNHILRSRADKVRK